MLKHITHLSRPTITFNSFKSNTYALTSTQSNYIFQKLFKRFRKKPKEVNAPPMPEAPIAQPEPKEIKFHNTTLIDSFSYLQDLDNPKTKAYIKAENLYAQQIMEHTEPLQEKLGEEILSMQPDAKIQVHSMEFSEGYVYLMVEKDSKILYLRKKMNNEELYNLQETFQKNEKEIEKILTNFDVLLDQQELAKEAKSEFADVIRGKLSDDQNYISYLVDYEGTEIYEAHVKDLRTGKIIDKITHCNVVNTEFGNNNNILYYTVADELNRPFKVMKHEIGKDVKFDEEIFREIDDSFFVDVNKTKDKKYITINVNSKTTSEVYLLDESAGNLRLVKKREENVEYYVEHNQGYVFIVTNANESSNFKIVYVEEDKLEDVNQWKEFKPESPQIRIDDMDMFKDYIVLYEKKNGLPQITIIDIKKSIENKLLNKEIVAKNVELPEPICSIEPGMNNDFESKTFFFSYQTIITPDTPCQVDMESGNVIQFPLTSKLPKNFDKNEYTIERVFAISHDGTSVPMTLAYKNDIQRDRNNPVVLNAYGAYGTSLELTFEYQRLALLSRGVIFAFAHVRGGGELGKQWHILGNKFNKFNSFYDLIACAEYLHQLGFTQPKKVCAKGVSAGGLLIGAVINMRQDLFRSVILKVPFLDVVTSLMDKSLPLTIHEYDEWGNINDENTFNFIHSYSPYQNLKELPYPHLFITASLSDYRVPYWQAVKYIAKWRQCNKIKTIGILKVRNHGHVDEAGKYGSLKDIVFEYAFICKSLGIKI